MEIILKIISAAFAKFNPATNGVVPASIWNGIADAVNAGKSEVVELLIEGGLSDAMAAGVADAVMAVAALAL